ncbi:MAG: class I SAM-dependent methyltransferase [Gammaproteobacteria bacterium]
MRDSPGCSSRSLLLQEVLQTPIPSRVGSECRLSGWARSFLMGSVRQFFDRFYGQHAADGTQPFEWQFAGANAAIPNDVRSILDVGCGTGDFLAMLPAKFRKVGTDLSLSALRRVPGDKSLASVESLPFKTAAFDLVSCFEVLEHLPSSVFRQALAELERVSARYILASVPNREVLAESLVCCPECSCAFHPSWHVRSFDPGALGTLFRTFTMINCSPCGPPIRYGSSRLARLAVLASARRPPATTTCPQCGYSSAGASKTIPIPQCGQNPGRQRASRLIRRMLHGILMRSERPYWLLALYARS